ncbi:hypothetical protein V2J09_018840 [Rumex salicifolius]
MSGSLDLSSWLTMGSSSWKELMQTAADLGALRPTLCSIWHTGEARSPDTTPCGRSSASTLENPGIKSPDSFSLPSIPMVMPNLVRKRSVETWAEREVGPAFQKGTHGAPFSSAMARQNHKNASETTHPISAPTSASASAMLFLSASAPPSRNLSTSFTSPSGITTVWGRMLSGMAAPLPKSSALEEPVLKKVNPTDSSAGIEAASRRVSWNRVAGWVPNGNAQIATWRIGWWWASSAAGLSSLDPQTSYTKIFKLWAKTNANQAGTGGDHIFSLDCDMRIDSHLSAWIRVPMTLSSLDICRASGFLVLHNRESRMLLTTNSQAVTELEDYFSFNL